MSPLEVSLNAQISERAELQDELILANKRVTSEKGSSKRQLKKAIRNYKRAINKLNRAIKKTQRRLIKEGKNDVAEILAEQGIDSRANAIGAVGDTIGELGKIAGDVLGSKLGGGGASRQFAQGNTPIKPYTDEKDNTMLYVGGGIALLVGGYLMMKKKK